MLTPLARHVRRQLVGYLALFVALGGSAYAATSLPPNSVTTVQVRNHSLLGADFRAGQLPAGKRGAPGPAGPAGRFDASNVSSAVGPLVTLCATPGAACLVGTSEAVCPAGSVPISGGWAHDQNNPLVAATPILSSPTQTGWRVIMVNNQDRAGGFQAVAVCAKA